MIIPDLLIPWRSNYDKSSTSNCVDVRTGKVIHRPISVDSTILNYISITSTELLTLVADIHASLQHADWLDRNQSSSSHGLIIEHHLESSKHFFSIAPFSSIGERHGIYKAYGGKWHLIDVEVKSQQKVSFYSYPKTIRPTGCSCSSHNEEIQNTGW